MRKFLETFLIKNDRNERCFVAVFGSSESDPD